DLMLLGVATSGALGLYFTGGSNLLSGAGTITAGTTHHVAATYDAAADTSTLYVDGVAVATGAHGPYSGPAVTVTQVAAYGNTEHFDGRLAEVAVYARALTAAEVLAHAEAAGLAATDVNGALVRRSSTLILGKPFAADEIPADFAAGSYTHRLDDAGEWSMTFPNAVAGDGVLWRDRFGTDGHRAWIEIYEGAQVAAGNLEFVGVVERITVTRDAVTVSGTDAFGLLRKAYETDREWTAAPADVIDAYTRVPVVELADDFDSAGLGARWFSEDPVGGSTSHTVTVADSALTVGVEAGAWHVGAHMTGGGLGDDWRSTVVIDDVNQPQTVTFTWSAGAPGTDEDDLVKVAIEIDQQPRALVTVTIGTGVGGTPFPQVVAATVPFSLPATLEVARRGRWVWVGLNGTLVAVRPWLAAATTVTRFGVTVLDTDPDSTESTVRIGLVTITDRRPFLRRGATAGDRHLPGALPTGGLHGRYVSSADLAGFADGNKRRYAIFTPGRPVAADRLDATPGHDAIATLPAGVPTDFFAVRWFGAVYLRGDLGDTEFRLTSLDDGARLWVARTGWGEQLIDDWNDAGSHTAGPVTLDSTLFGDRAAWVPIIVEYHDATGAADFYLEFKPPGTGSYTDPSGGTITRGSWQTIPSTSLSPLGCFDQRVQGASHFDVVKQAASAFGYQVWLEPMQLESGEFPGRLVPRERYGRDTDVVLRSEDLDPAEPLLTPTVEIDATDIATTLRGTGAGIADGRGSQVTAEMTDTAAATVSLFDLQAWSDAGDIAFTDLLRARLEAELGLRNTPWMNVTGQPRARRRLADTWPLSAMCAAMRWRPGDGVRISLPEIGVDDTSPRQIMQVTREIVPDGIASAQVGFRQRPKGAAHALRRVARAALLPQRVYQRQVVTLPGTTYWEGSINAGQYTGYVKVPLLPGDQVVKAVLRVANNSGAQGLGVEIDGVDRTSTLGGSWSLVPTEVDITAHATQASATDPRLYARLRNNGGSATWVEFSVEVQVLR
ncbi:MAG: LamG-like jellyroll fold domain-containing protein, partial [Actinomycetota bacterium]